MKHHNDNCVFDTEKINQRLSELTEKKYSEEDMRKCFEAAMALKPNRQFSYSRTSPDSSMLYATFEDYLNTLKQ